MCVCVCEFLYLHLSEDQHELGGVPQSEVILSFLRSEDILTSPHYVARLGFRDRVRHLVLMVRVRIRG